MRFVCISGFTQPPQIIYPGANETTIHPVSHNPFFPLNQGQPWLHERVTEKPTQSPDTGSQSADEDEEDGRLYLRNLLVLTQQLKH